MCCNRHRPRRTEPLPSSGASVAGRVWQSVARGQAPTGTYEGEGYVILRHPETAVVERALKHLISTVRVELAPA